MDRYPYSDIFHDWEFHEQGPGKPIEAITAGFVCGDRQLYFALNDFDWYAVANHPWLSKNVWPYLPQTKEGLFDHKDVMVLSRAEAAEAVEDFIRSAALKPRLWAWYAAYDHVMYSQLFGKMVNLPDGLPMHTCDLKQYHEDLGEPDLPAQDAKLHHALADAEWNQQVKAYLDDYKKSMLTGS